MAEQELTPDEARIRTVKEEVIRELSQRAEERHRGEFDAGSLHNLKNEIVAELSKRREESAMNKENYERLKRDLLYEIGEMGYRDRTPYRADRPDPSEKRILDSLRQELQADLKARQVYEDYWRQNRYRSPHAGKMTADLLEEAQEQGLSRAELLRAVQQLQQRGTLRGKVREALASPEGQGFKWGIVSAVLALMLLPSLGRSLRPVAKWAVKEAQEINENVQGFVSKVTEDVQDIFAEAQYERNKNVVDAEVVPDKAPEADINTTKPES